MKFRLTNRRQWAARPAKGGDNVMKCNWPLLALLLLLMPLTAHASEVQSIKAVVNGEIITSYDFDQRWSTIYKRIKQQYGDKLQHPDMQKQLADLKDKLLGQMVDETIMAQESARKGVVIEDADIDAYIANFKREQHMDEEQFQQSLTRNNLTEEELRKQIKEDMVKRRMVQNNVSSRIVVTDQEIMDAYKKQSGAKEGETLRQVDLSVIMAADKGVMDKIVEEIKGGMSFAEAADTYSTGPAVGAGGSLGTFSFSDLAETWRNALEGVEKGEMSEPFEADGQFVLLKVLDEGEGQTVATMDEATHDAIYEELRKKKFDALFEEFMETLRERAVVEYK
ncbi:MAG: SurA N-terminal domain-containing protein [Desulfovibrio sp.]